MRVGADLPGAAAPASASPARLVRRLFFRLRPDETSFVRRGFPSVGRPAQARLERIASTFVEGYHAAVDAPEPDGFIPRLEQIPGEFRGFAYEGAAMALGLLDLLTPWNRSRFSRYLERAPHHDYMLHVGLGWAWARLRSNVQKHLDRSHPDLRWLALDGYGFHDGFFHWERTLDRREPPRLRGYEARAFDQGLGRSLWFVEGADVRHVAARVGTFDPARQPDLWAGVGLACAYAGGVDDAGLQAIREAAGAFRPQLAQGVSFAVVARYKAQNPAEHTTRAAEFLCRRSFEDLGKSSTELFDRITGGDGAQPRYELWRQAIQRQFPAEVA
ncbi:MAG TPA: DUF1702 family protein [Myxococcales bacterium]|nr:DUF1702 family protein [Myxococcales bacterium]